MSQDKGKNIVITGLTSLFTDVSSEMVYPIIALYLQALGTGMVTLGAIEGVAESTASLLKIFSGTFADWTGKRKPLTIFGYSLSAVGKILFFFALGWPMVLLGRFIDRFGKGIRTAPRDAIIAESASSHSQGKAFGLHRTFDTLGAVIGVLITYFLLARFAHGEDRGTLAAYLPTFRLIILASILPAIFGVLILFLTVETGQGKRAPSFPLHFQTFKELSPQLKLFLLATLLFTLGNSSNQFIFLRAAEKDVGFLPHQVVLLYFFYNVVYALVSYPAGKLSDRAGRKWLLIGGFSLYSLSYYLIGWWPQGILFTMIPYGLHMGITEGISKALISDLAPAHKKATILGLHAMLLGIGLLPASVMAGWLWKTWGPASPFLFGGTLSLSASFLLIFAL